LKLVQFLIVNSYALTLVLKTDLDEKVRKELLESVTKKFEKIGKTDSAKASTVKEDLWGARDLAYPIKHQTKGWYAHYLFDADPQVAASLDKTLKIEEDILRYLLVRV